jgi:hypothetical protein
VRIIDSKHHWYDVTCTVAYNYVCEDTFEDPCKGCKLNVMTFLGSTFIFQPFSVANYSISKDLVSFCSYFIYIKSKRLYSKSIIPIKSKVGLTQELSAKK